MNPMKKSKFNGWQRVLLIIVPYIIIGGLFQVIGSKIAGIDIKDMNGPKDSYQFCIIAIFSLIGTFLTVLLFKAKVDRESFWSIGFSFKNRGKDLILGLALGLLIMGFGFIILVYLNEIKFVAINFNLSKLLLSILLFVSVALGEELLIRGYVLSNLMKSFNKYTALIISSLIFSAAHLANPDFSWFAFLNIIFAGLLLGLSYIYTKNIWFPVALHFSWNFFQGSIFGFSVSGQTTYSLIEQSRLSDNLWNGGQFGFEGSMLAIAFQIIGIFIIWKYFHKESRADNLSASTNTLTVVPVES